MAILRIGTGDTMPKQPGYLNIDIRPLPDIDVVADAAKLPFTDGEHDGLESRNLVEHFGRHEVLGLFKEWARVLKPGSLVSIETVNMGALMDNWKNIPTENLLDGILGAQTYPENFHKMAFTPDILCEKLHSVGFDIFDLNLFDMRQIPRMVILAIKQ